MEIASPDGRSRFTFDIVEWPTYEVLAAVSVSVPGFSGSNPAVAYYWQELERFLTDLEVFSTQQLGEVVVDSMMRGEGKIRFFQLDRARHVAIEVQVGHGHTVRPDQPDDHVSVAWEVEPSQLSAIAEGFGKEVAQAANRGSPNVT